jgi:hypothetical protein
LYNLSSDPGERNNIAGEHPEIVQRLSRMAREFDGGIEPVMKLPSPSWSVFRGLTTQAPKDPSKVPH